MNKQSTLSDICRRLFLTLAPLPVPRLTVLTENTLLPKKFSNEYVNLCDIVGMFARIVGAVSLTTSMLCDDAPENLKYVSLASYSLATVLQDGIAENYLKWYILRERQILDKLRKQHGY